MAVFEFRDGKRELPDYLGTILAPYEDRLYRLTYEQAIEFANKLMLSNFVDAASDRILAEHFRRTR